MFERVDVPASVSEESVDPRGMLWVEVDPGFFVGNDRRQYLGSISARPEGGFSAFGARSDFIGQFDELDQAKDAVLRASVVRTAAEVDGAHRVLQRVRDLFTPKRARVGAYPHG